MKRKLKARAKQSLTPLKHLYEVAKKRMDDVILLADFLEKVEPYKKPLMVLLKVILLFVSRHYL